MLSSRTLLTGFALVIFLFGTVLGAQTVSPGSINIDPSAACGGGSDSVEDVCIRLPDGGTCGTVDVFLLFDDTGSFANNVVTTRNVFNDIVNDLTINHPNVDFAFGVGRYEDYGGPGASFGGLAKDRPFILNQAILRTGHPLFSVALDAALAADPNGTPADGGELPESAIEALFQTATGFGFDANNDADTLDVSTGDVPAFAQYTGLASGTLGGAGWRPESCLRLVILPTDICSVAPFAAGGIPATVEGTGGSEPSSAFSCGGGSRFGLAGGVAPANAATVPATVQAVNDLGVRVIGLGPGAGPTSSAGPSSAPSVFLSALARLTGAVDSGGNPLVFDLGAGSTGIRTAIVDAVTTSLTTPIDIALVPDPEIPGLTVTTDPAVHTDVEPGEEVCFTVNFEGDATFAGGNLGLDFVDVASGGSLGMRVPVNLKCPKCFDLVTTTRSCDVDDGGFTDSFEWTFIIRNRAAEDVSHLFFVDLPAGVTIEPQHLTFTPAIKTNQPRKITVKVNNVTPGTVLDFRITLHDATFAECCAMEVTLEVPECDCAQLRVDSKPTCFNFPPAPIPPWRYRFDLENLTTDPVDYLLLAPVSPADLTTPLPPTDLVIDPNVLMLGSTLGTGDTTGSITVGLSGPAATPGEQVCFLLSTHDATFADCCSIVKCLTIPDCTFGMVDFEELGGSTLTYSGSALIVSDIGAGGDDGVAASFAPASEVGVSLQDFSADLQLTDGAAVRFTAGDDSADVPDLVAMLDQEGVRVFLEGASELLEVRVLLDGDVVASSALAEVATAAAGDWPTGFVMVDDIAGFAADPASIKTKDLITSLNVAGVTWSEPVALALGDWTGMGDEVSFAFDDTVSVDGATRAELTAALIPTLVIKRFDFEPAAPIDLP